jgi:thiamine biosynthesis lipoprotein
MRRRTLLSASLGLGALTGLGSQALSPAGLDTVAGLALYTGSDVAFGTIVTIKLLHSDAHDAQAAIQYALHEVKQIDALMSLHQETSQVFELNRRGVLPLPHPHLLHVLAFSQALSQLTDGAFDITVQPLWQAFSLASASAALPAPEKVAAAKSLVSWQRLAFAPQQVRLPAAGMAITLNGVAQGYAVDLALQALRSRGVRHALLDTGEFGSAGSKAQGRPWVLGVAHPRQHDAMSATVQMDGRMVATSGDYETFFSPDFVHHHIFYPTTGESPLELASVTVVAPTGILADGLSTAFMVMGADKSLALAAQMQDVDVMLIHKNGRICKSPQFPDLAT